MPPPRGVSVAGPLPEPVEGLFWGPLNGSLPKPVEAPFPGRADGSLPKPVEAPLPGRADGSLPKPVEAPFPGRADGSLPKPVEGPPFDDLPVLVSTLIPHSPCPEFRRPGGARHVLPGSVLLFGPPAMRPGAADSRATRRARTGSSRPHTAVDPANLAVGRRTRAARDR